MTLTYPIINRAHHILWLVTGSEKQKIFERFRKEDGSIPASRINRGEAVVITDYAVVAHMDLTKPK
jgi:6-phosphogluconolactonase/glucosamine-6-phosphate isomerase/deaminase